MISSITKMEINFWYNRPFSLGLGRYSYNKPADNVFDGTVDGEGDINTDLIPHNDHTKTLDWSVETWSREQ